LETIRPWRDALLLFVSTLLVLLPGLSLVHRLAGNAVTQEVEAPSVTLPCWEPWPR
jgi:hypothetical protein